MIVIHLRLGVFILLHLEPAKGPLLGMVPLLLLSSTLFVCRLLRQILNPCSLFNHEAALIF
jgi:hypothetical protein